MTSAATDVVAGHHVVRDGERVLLARLDSMGDVLLAGPAVRAIHAAGGEVTLLCSPRGAAAARLLPGVADVLVFDAGWVSVNPPPFSGRDVRRLGRTIRRMTPSRAVILTSDHQSPLPLAMVLRLSRVPWVGAVSRDYAGSLLDLRLRPVPGEHEAERSRRLGCAAGGVDDGATLALRPDLPEVSHLVGPAPYVVVHPGSDAPTRSIPPMVARIMVQVLAAAGHRVVVTGAEHEWRTAAFVAGESGLQLAGRTSLAELAAVLRNADALVVGNTGPAHLAAAVGTPVVSIHAPVVDAQVWRPLGVPVVQLGDQEAPCAGSRARDCPVIGHPCVASVRPHDVLDAVATLLDRPDLAS